MEAAPSKALIVFDINLRGSFYSTPVILDSLGRSQILKLNQDELSILMRLLGIRANGGVEITRELLFEFNLELVCVTRGERGSVLVTRTDSLEHAGVEVAVDDTVGSGDAFTAALVHSYLNGAGLERMSETANRLGSWVATQAGAQPRGPVPFELLD
jgi:fructokinase